jgi:hypothetical protein
MWTPRALRKICGGAPLDKIKQYVEDLQRTA